MAANGPRREWAPRPADRIVRRPRAGDIAPVHVDLRPRRVSKSAVSPPLILVYGFGALVSLGTVLLILPFAHRGAGLPLVDALFTAMSAATVTGLITQETSSYWTLPGQAVILLLMFAGGLGIMTVVGVLLLVAGQRISLTQRLVMRETIGTHAFAGIMGVTARIVIWATLFQAVGFAVLFARFAGLYPVQDAAWHALFQAVSGFNNAGFTSIPASDNLSVFQTDKVVLGCITALIVLGSLSYGVMSNVFERRRFSRLRLNTKLVLVFTGGCILAGAVAFFWFESGNSGTIGDLTVFDKLTTSVFHSVNRTSGFSTVDFGQTTDQTNVFYTVLMLIGGASASVAGGIKVNTFAIIVMATLAALRGKRDVTAFSRRIPGIQVRWAQALTIGSVAAIFVLGLTLASIERGYPLWDLVFEAVSALGTVGFSTGITGDLSIASQLLLAIGMFIGRVVPPMVIVKALSQESGEEKSRHPRENVQIG